MPMAEGASIRVIFCGNSVFELIEINKNADASIIMVAMKKSIFFIWLTFERKHYFSRSFLRRTALD